jgi:hypothetical protein
MTRSNRLPVSGCDRRLVAAPGEVGWARHYLEVVADDVRVPADPDVSPDLSHGIDTRLGENDFALLLESLRVPHRDDP